MRVWVCTVVWHLWVWVWMCRVVWHLWMWVCTVVLHLWMWVPTSMFLQSRAAKLSLLSEANWEGENRREVAEVSYQNLARTIHLFQTNQPIPTFPDLVKVFAVTCHTS